MTRPVIITCAVNGGSEAALAEHPAIPRSPAEICQAAMEAAEAGAAIVHIHAREPDSGKPSNRIELHREIVGRIRATDRDIVLNLTCSMASILTIDETAPPRLGPGTSLGSPAERVRHALELEPEIATIDCGTFGIGEDIFVGRPSDLRAMATLLSNQGIRPELECFELGHIETAKALIAGGFVLSPAFIQICLGTGYGAPDNVAALDGMRAQLPPGAVWAAFGCGQRQLGLVTDIVRAGGHVRVGLEDARVMADGSLASNAALVAEAAQLIRAAGCTVATPDQARSILQLRGRPG